MTEKGLTLYEIADSMKKLEQLINEDEGLVEYLDSVELQFNDKVENIVKFNRGLELSAEAIDAEIERLTLMKRMFVTKRQRLLDYVKYIMVRNDITEVKTSIARLSFRKSSAVVIDDKEQLPAEFIRVKTVAEPDKVAIGEVLKAGQQVPGAHLEEHQNLQIK